MGSNTTHTLYLFTADGQTATVPVKLLQQSEDPEQGLAYPSLTPLTAKDRITCVLSLPPGDAEGYLVAISELGEVKRLRFEDLPGMLAHPFKFMDIEQEDRLIWVAYVDDDGEVILVTLQGRPSGSKCRRCARPDWVQEGCVLLS